MPNKLKKTVFAVILGVSCLYSQEYYYQQGKKTIITPKNQIARDFNSVKYYLDRDGMLLGVKNKILVKFKSDADIGFLLNKFALHVVKNLGGRLYLLEVSEANQTLQVANAMYEAGYAEFAHPDFVKQMRRR